MIPPVGDPEDTVPFTHQPYGQDSEDNPYVSPSGPAAQPSGPGYVTPPPPPPQVPYGPPPTTPYAYRWTPAYGAPYPGSLTHKGGTTALTLGIIAIASLLLTPFCCITLPGVFCAPFAWVAGAHAKRDIERHPGVYGNLAAAQTGMWMGIVMTFLGALVVAGFVALAAWIGYADPSLV